MTAHTLPGAELLPCPFCGAPAETEHTGDTHENEVSVSCSNAECCASVICCDHEQWNGRPAPSQAAEKSGCDACEERERMALERALGAEAALGEANAALRDAYTYVVWEWAKKHARAIARAREGNDG